MTEGSALGKGRQKDKGREVVEKNLEFLVKMDLENLQTSIEEVLSTESVQALLERDVALQKTSTR